MWPMPILCLCESQEHGQLTVGMALHRVPEVAWQSQAQQLLPHHPGACDHRTQLPTGVWEKDGHALRDRDH